MQIALYLFVYDSYFCRQIRIQINDSGTTLNKWRLESLEGREDDFYKDHMAVSDPPANRHQ